VSVHQSRTPDRISRNHRPSRTITAIAGTAAALAGTALYNTYQAYQSERENPPLGDFLKIDGVRLHYLEAGKGLPVVLLHGNGTTLDDFVASGLFDLVSRSHRVIALDRPGYGYSERPRFRLWTPDAQAALLQQAFDQLSIERPVVLGHSWGTMVAMALALRSSTALRGLVLLSGYYFPTARADVPILAPPGCQSSATFCATRSRR
jgi:pimeloyl-ACP methyl ester carboxylesterase